MKHREVIEAEEFIRLYSAVPHLEAAMYHIKALLALWNRQQDAEKVEVAHTYCNGNYAGIKAHPNHARPGTYLKQLEATDE